MKKNIALRLASGLMLSCLLSTCVISGTFAKYVSTYDGSDSARVAKWTIKTNENTENEFSFDLFETILDETGDPETDVADGLIAPGTKGEFSIELTNESEVTAQYALDYTVTNSGIPVQFSVDDGQTWTDELTDVVASDATELTMGSGVKTIKVQWKWVFDGNDTTDTTLGEKGTDELKVEVKVTVTQKN